MSDPRLTLFPGLLQVLGSIERTKGFVANSWYEVVGGGSLMETSLSVQC